MLNRRLGIATFILLLGALAAAPLCVLLYVSYSWQVAQLREDVRVVQERDARGVAREIGWRLQAFASQARLVQEISARQGGIVAPYNDPPDLATPPAGTERMRLSPITLEAGEQVAYLSMPAAAEAGAPGPLRVPLRTLLAGRAADAPAFYLVDQKGTSLGSAEGRPEKLAALAQPGLAAVAPVAGGWRVVLPRDTEALAARESALRQRYLIGGFLALAVGLALVHFVALRVRGAMDDVMSDFGDEDGSRPDSVITELAEIGDALASARARFGQTASELERARHDALTGLPGRDLFMGQATAQVTAAREMDDYAVAILYIDLDGFKAVNDSQGHRAGDDVLRGMAAILRQNVRAPDSLGRIGGDEFVVCVSAPRRHLMEIAMRARDGIGRDVAALGPGVGCSIGWATASCERNLTDLIEEADAAMYVAKQARRHAGRTSAPLT